MDVTALASLAANTVVAAAATDAFEAVRDRIARLFGRGRPDPATERRLGKTRAELSAATSTDAVDVEAAQRVQWRVRFADLCETYPEVVPELSRLVAELQAQLPGSGNVSNVIAGGTHHGPILMGRDFTGVTIRPDQQSSADQ
jgi:hypothetical protein